MLLRNNDGSLHSLAFAKNMPTIHIKPPCAPQSEISLDEANRLLQKGELPFDTLAWAPGMPEWLPLHDIPGIAAQSPPPLPATAQTVAQPASPQEKPKKKPSIKAIISLILVILGFMMMAVGTGFGVIAFLAGIVMGWFASRDFKKRPDQVGGKGALTAVRVLVMIFCLMIAIALLTVVVPSCSSAVDKAKQSAKPTAASRSTAGASTLEATALSSENKRERVYGGLLKYSFEVGPDWKAFYSEKPFDLALQNTPIYITVIAEDQDVGPPEVVAEQAINDLKTKSGVLEMTEPDEVQVDGKTWLAFEAKTPIKDKIFTTLYRVYSGPEGTFQVVGFTSKEMRLSQREEIKEVMDTFRFPE
jgi:hypothetical protein